MTEAETDRRKELLAAAKQGKLLLRDMLNNDLPSVLAIENLAQLNPWSRSSFEETLTGSQHCRVIELHHCSELVTGDVSELAAYHVVSVVLDELHVLNVVAAPQFQGLGLGHMLMSDIVAFAESRDLRKIFLEVRESNEVAKNLYLKWQFTQISLRKKYYRATGASATKEDAFVYMRKL
jgi:ribosomal-protein-alanine N-acetyltransferase